MSKPGNSEIERKFLVKEIPFELNTIECKSIAQGYYISEDRQVYRVRKLGEKYFRTWKSSGTLVRTEIENEITEEVFNKIWLKTAGWRIIKKRYFIDYMNFVIELDVFEGDHKNLVMAEIEFESLEQSEAFFKPDWLGEEVTSDENYKNSNLAINGIPEYFNNKHGK